MRKRPVGRRVWMHRALALAWLILGGVSFLVGWSDSVVLIWIASVYANIASAMSAGEAADDSKIMTELKELRAELRTRERSHE